MSEDYGWVLEATEVVNDRANLGAWVDGLDDVDGKLVQEWICVPWPISNDVPALLRALADQWERANERADEWEDGR